MVQVLLPSPISKITLHLTIQYLVKFKNKNFNIGQYFIFIFSDKPDYSQQKKEHPCKQEYNNFADFIIQ